MFTLSQAKPSLEGTELLIDSPGPCLQAASVSDAGNWEPVFGLQAGRQEDPAGQGRITSTSEHYTIPGATCWTNRESHLFPEVKLGALKTWPLQQGGCERGQVGVNVSISQRRKQRDGDFPRDGHSVSTEAWQSRGQVRISDFKGLSPGPHSFEQYRPVLVQS